MNYVMCYDFDNFDSVYECIPSVRNGVAFCMCDCIIKEEAEVIFEKVSKLLLYIFSLPIFNKENRYFEV